MFVCFQACEYIVIVVHVVVVESEKRMDEGEKKIPTTNVMKKI